MTKSSRFTKSSLDKRAKYEEGSWSLFIKSSISLNPVSVGCTLVEFFFSNQTLLKNMVYPQGPIVAGKYMDIIVTVIIIGEIFTVI